MFHASLAVLHALVAAVWLGAMVYSLTVVQPRARDYFATDDELEQFIATLGHGARWKVLTAFALMAVSGAGLSLLAERPWSMRFQLLLGAKIAMYLLALPLFA